MTDGWRQEVGEDCGWRQEVGEDCGWRQEVGVTDGWRQEVGEACGVMVFLLHWEVTQEMLTLRVCAGF